MKVVAAAFAAVLSALVQVRGAVPSNTVWIAPQSSDQAARPVSISRFFAQGEIPNSAQAVINGERVPTQCDVRTRWADGSVQHAVVTVRVPLSRGNTTAVDFVDATPGEQGEGLTAEDMLNFGGGTWQAVLQASAGGIVHRVDAREMLQGGAWRYWMRGPLVTQVIVEGRSSHPDELFRFDFGWTCQDNCVQPYDQSVWAEAQTATQRSLHPIFVLTFYDGHPGVQVEFILENIWTTKLQDQRFDLSLYTETEDRAVYQRRDLVHIAKTRWRKTFWSGSALPDWESDTQPGIRVDYNLPYLIYSRALPNYDTRLRLPKAYIDAETRELQRNSGGEESQFCTTRVFCGQWYRYMGSAGARGDIAVVPRWYLKYLYTFDPALYSVMIQNAAVSGVVPVHVRESAEGRPFLSEQEGHSALGRPLSLNARPTVFVVNGGTANVLPQDMLKPIGTVSCLSRGDFACSKYYNDVWSPGMVNDWKVDISHQPAMAYVPYLITGDWYLLQEIFYWASYNAASSNSSSGPAFARHGTWGVIEWAGSMRAEAWGLRNLAYAALLAPLGTPERTYYGRLVENNIAVKEGRQGIRDGQFFEPNAGGDSENPCPASSYNADTATRWCWGWVTLNERRANPLGFPGPGTLTLEGVRKDLALTANSIWMDHYLRVSYGHLLELGFPLGKLVEQQNKNIISQLQDSGYNPFLAFEYRGGARRLDGEFFQTWPEVKETFVQSTALRHPASASDLVLETELLDAAGLMYVIPVQTVQIEDEAVRVCKTSYIVENGAYVASRLHICDKGRGVNGTTASDHAAGTLVRRSFSEVPTSYATNVEGGYAWLTRAAASYAFKETAIDSDGQTVLSGENAWAWLESVLAPWQNLLANNPMWAIIPRNDEALAKATGRGRAPARTGTRARSAQH